MFFVTVILQLAFLSAGLSASDPATCSSFTSSVEEGRAICPGEKLTYNCTVFDNVNLVPTAVWSGFCADSSVINIAHGVPVQESGLCGPFSVQAADANGNCYTSTLTVTASPELNGTIIQCSHESFEVGRATLLVVGDLLSLKSTYDVELMLVSVRAELLHCYPKENYNITYSCDSHVIESDLLKCTVREEACSHTLVVKQLSDHSQTQLRNAEVCSVALSTADYLVDEKIISTTSKDVFEVEINSTIHPPVASCNTVLYNDNWCCKIELSYPGEHDNSINTTILSGCISSSTFSTALQVPPKTKFEVNAFSVNCGCEDSQIPYFSIHASSTSGTKNCNKGKLGEDFGTNCMNGSKGYVAYNGLDPGSIAMYTCCNGYKLIGSQSLTCLDDGVWDNNPPFCESKQELFTTAAIATTAVLSTFIVALLVLAVYIFFTKKESRPPSLPPSKDEIQAKDSERATGLPATIQAEVPHSPSTCSTRPLLDQPTESVL